MLNPHYVSGFVDGEGAFSVTVSPRSSLNVGWEIRPSFSISQNKASRSVIFKVKEFFNCGHIRPSKKDNTVKYEVRSLEELQRKIIPHFEKYSLHTSKQKNFEIFKKVVQLMSQDKHLETEGIKEIFTHLEKLNESSKKIYNRKKLQGLMNV